MACGVLISAVANQDGSAFVNKRRRKVGDIVCLYRAEQCTEDPSPSSPFKILLISDAEVDELKTICQERVDSKAETYERSLCSINPALLPAPVTTALQSKGRATCTKAQFLSATFNKEYGLQLSVCGLPEAGLVRIAEKIEDARRVRDRG